VGSADSIEQAWVGRALPRKEDQALPLRPARRFIDDLAPYPGPQACRHPALASSARTHP